MDKENKKDIQFGCWDMGRFLRHFLIHIFLLALGGVYILGLVLGDRFNLLVVNNYLSLILTIVAVVLSVVAIILTYYQTKQSDKLIEKITAIDSKITSKTEGKEPIEVKPSSEGTSTGGL